MREIIVLQKCERIDSIAEIMREKTVEEILRKGKGKEEERKIGIFEERKQNLGRSDVNWKESEIQGKRKKFLENPKVSTIEMTSTVKNSGDKRPENVGSATQGGLKSTQQLKSMQQVKINYNGEKNRFLSDKIEKKWVGKKGSKSDRR